MNNFLEIKNLTKNYFNQKKINVLKNLNYKFKKGKTYSLVGPSGSGKSTLLNILSLIDRPTNGNLFINNKKINFEDISHNDKIRSNNYGIIYQEKNLLNDFTAQENIILAGIANGKSEIQCIELAEKILKNNNISAIFCADDTMAFGCIDYIKKETKLRIPNQIEIVGYDDMIMANWNSYNLSTIRQPIRQMSKLTTQLIDDYLQDPDFEPANHLIEGKFIKRKTTKNSL